jgi:eukaryotic-like serine/threonine-protein kinase
MTEQAVNNSQSEILQDRYQLGELLGTGATGSTYQAIDLETNITVAVKILSLRGMQDWKTLELFEREAKILAQLDHSQIPKYLDFFYIDTEANRRFCIVQQLAPGRSLANWVASGDPFTVPEVKDIALQTLDILKYLQSFSPAIIHRDLKPQNIICDNRPTWDMNAYYRPGYTHIYLVDFGAVRDTYHQTITGGSTVVGTYGYMAPEQFRGQANMSTDLYGLATTLLFLLTGQDPADLPQQNMKLDTQDIVKDQDFERWGDCYQYFKSWIDRCLEPFPENRFASAGVALKYLQHHHYGCERPKHLLAQVTRSDEPPELHIYMPPVWLKSKVSRQIFTVNTVILAVVCFLTWLLVTADLPSAAIIILMTLTGVGGMFLSRNVMHEYDCENYYYDRKKNSLRWWWNSLTPSLHWLVWLGLPIATFILILISGHQMNYVLPFLPVLLFLWSFIIIRCWRHLRSMSESYSYHLTTGPDDFLNYKTDRIRGWVALNCKRWLWFNKRINFNDYGCSVSDSRFNFLSLVDLIDKDEEWWLDEEIRNFIEIHKIR